MKINEEDVNKVREEFKKLEDNQRKKDTLILCGTALALGMMCASSYYAGVNQGFRLGVNTTAMAIRSRFPTIMADAICEKIANYKCPIRKVKNYFPAANFSLF